MNFPAKKSWMVCCELPFALPTAVAGISLTSLTSDNGLIGSFFARFRHQDCLVQKWESRFALIFVGNPVCGKG